jgi:VWFA-related protein
MTRRQFLSAALFTGTALAQEPTFTAGVQVVNILATVRNKKTDLVPDLTADDFTVLENGRPQTIRYFARDADLPITIGLLVDTSLSQEHVLDAERGAAFRFFDQVLRERKDQVFITQFDINVHTLQGMTSSRRDLNDALIQIVTPTRQKLRTQYGGGTLLFDAVVDAARDPLKHQTGRKAMIILSDGGDNGSDQTVESAIDEAQRADTLIFSILYTAGGLGAGRGKRVMARMANETGGSFFEVSGALPIDRVFTIIQEELRTQYSIGFTSDHPATFAEFRKVQLTVKRPGLLVHARDRYWAGAS